MTSPIRQAWFDDAAVVARLLDEFDREFSVPTPGAEVITARLQRVLARGDVIGLLADDPAIGIALVTLRPDIWHDRPVALLDALYVVPSVRGQGVGSALLSTVELALRERGVEVLGINVNGTDVDARRFYERHGYDNLEPGRGGQLLYYIRRLPA